MTSASSLTDLYNPSSPAYRKAKRQYLKTTKHRDNDIDLEWTPFRAAEKRYKARFPPPDLSQTLDLALLDEERSDEIYKGIWAGHLNAVGFREITTQTSLPGENRKAYAIPSVPGLVLLPSFVQPAEQRELIKWALCNQARYPNETNLDIHYDLPKSGIWNSFLSSRTDSTKDILVQPKASGTDLVEQTPTGPRNLINNTPVNSDNFLSLLSIEKPPQPPSPTVKPALSSALLRKLRWANIGWYYHWGTKQYDFTKGKGIIDSKVREICKSAVDVVDWECVHRDTDDNWGEAGPEWKHWHETYEPDAGIVNFYQTKDTLMAHVDRSEVCATSPLVSISLGNAAVFLIGGLTRDVEPIPIILRSGDIVIMSGPACRRAYHGVPRILEGTFPPHLEGEADDQLDWALYEEFMCSTRININVRQVFPKGFDPSVL